MESKLIDETVSLNEEFTNVLSQLNGLKSYCTSVINQVKALEKSVKKQKSKKDKKKASGFAVPSKVSSTLSNFMGLEEGQLVARTEVTKFIINYIKTNNLQNPLNNQCIIPDKKLNSLFNYEDNETKELTYFNIQKHMNRHFI